MGNRVPRVRTQVSESQMAHAFIESWKQLFHTEPTKEQISLLMAQNSLETGNRKQMWNFNVGNITTNGKGSYDFFDDLPTDEQIQPGVWKRMNLKYRAYPSLVDGAKDYLKLLSGKSYSNVWSNIVNPNPVAFSKALKQRGYYTANEAPYTKGLKSLYNRFSKSDSYEKAMGGQVAPVQYIAQNKGKPMNDTRQLDDILNTFLQMVAASERSNGKLYKKYLPTNNILIKVMAFNYTDAVEFAHVLSSALDEELFAQSAVHTDGKRIEVECAVQGPAQECVDTVTQLTDAIVDTFSQATAKIGHVMINTRIISNKKSSYQMMNLKTAEIQHRKFLLKFI
jgi:hypothetical protein